MHELIRPRVAIVDIGMGNLFSVAHACSAAGLEPLVTDHARTIERCDAVILPGVGAFGDAMRHLRELDLVGLLREIAVSDTPLLGICLGLQLLLRESLEFGAHEGLGIIDGIVRPFPSYDAGSRRWKVPHVGWAPVRWSAAASADPLLANVADGELMYFVHSLHADAADSNVVLGRADYAGVRFCAAVRAGNAAGFQFHPERSGRAGLKIYENLRRELLARREAVPQEVA